MEKRVLVAYATQAGSTAEVAEAIGRAIAEFGAAVDVCRAKDADGVGTYDAIIIGSASYKQKILPEATEFARRHRDVLNGLPTAYFTTGLTMVEDTPEHRAKATSYLDPLCDVRRPVGLGLFAGKVDHTKLPFPWNVALSFVKQGPMADADHRDWKAIREWALEIAPRLLHPAATIPDEQEACAAVA